MRYITHSEAETRALARSLAPLFKAGQVICLRGNLGAGKTSFVKGALEGLGYDDEVTSPTFALCHRYETKPPVLHYDLYRLKDTDDLYSIDFFDDINEKNCVFIEWSELADNMLPNKISINFEYGDKENERIITVEEV